MPELNDFLETYVPLESQIWYTKSNLRGRYPLVKLGRTIKLRLYPDTNQAEQFLAMSQEYQRVANIVSQWIFDHEF